MTPLGTEFQIHSSIQGDQDMVDLVPLAGGGFVALFESDDPILETGFFNGIAGKLFTAGGAEASVELNLFAGFSPDLDMNRPQGAALADGGFIVTFHTYDGDQEGVFARRFDASGVATGPMFQVNGTTSGSQSFPVVAGLPDGGWVIAWHSRFQDGDDYGVYMRRYDSAGATLTPELLVNTVTAGFQQDPAITPLLDGGWVVTWESGVFFGAGAGSDGDRAGIFAQRYGSTGAAVGGQLQLNTIINNNQVEVGVAALASGGYVAVWESFADEFSGGDPESGVYGRLVGSDGVPIGSDFRINTTLIESQWQPEVTALPDGGFVVTWEDEAADGSGTGIFGQRFDASATKVGTEFRVNTTTTDRQEFPSVTTLADGNIVAAWVSMGQDGDGFGVFGQVFQTGLAPAEPTEGPDVLLGTEGDDDINGLGGGDSIEGLGGDDDLRGGSGSDTLDGGDGNDTLYAEDLPIIGTSYDFGEDLVRGGAGDDLIVTTGLLGGVDQQDTFYGNAGTDALMFQTADIPIVIEGTAVIDMTQGRAFVRNELGEDAATGVTFAGIEDIVWWAGYAEVQGDGQDNRLQLGSSASPEANGNGILRGGQGVDTLSGGNHGDRLEGQKGHDSIFAGAGDDTVDGGNGRDTAWMGAGNDLYLDNTQASPLNDDSVYGEAGDDTILGGNGFDLFDGGAGADWIRAGKGADTVLGGDQADTIYGNDGNDVVRGGLGSDYVILGTGFDDWTDETQGAFGDDVVFGGGGWDTMLSAGGNDTLTGGAGADTFIFAATIGQMVITDYEVGTDVLRFENTLWGGEVTQAYLDSIATVDDGTDLVLALAGDASLTLEGVTSTAGLLADIGIFFDS
ncbi:calcium-binding protein [Mesobacterium pallidum]|uniref:calcium-binding protein n=1 Tax=Mesobacterium pallidum TaxID=2872037 RepID=UPI001EE26883|nr:calcium-binding protein [Mesobacterium pallidum]